MGEVVDLNKYREARVALRCMVAALRTEESSVTVEEWRDLYGSGFGSNLPAVPPDPAG